MSFLQKNASKICFLAGVIGHGLIRSSFLQFLDMKRGGNQFVPNETVGICFENFLARKFHKPFKNIHFIYKKLLCFNKHIKNFNG